MSEATLMSSSQVGGGMTMVMAETKVRKTREGKPKSRNGCKTCKLRRVKCDETKPHCMRCTRFGQRCDGYITRTPSKTSLQITTTRTLAPRGSDQSPGANPRSEHSSESPNGTDNVTLNSVHGPMFHSQEDYIAFNRFCERSSIFLSQIPLEKWSSIVLQACESSDSIRYAVTSIGRLDTPASEAGHEHGVGTLHHQSAYGQYQQSSCTFRKTFGGELYDFRTTLTGCLLFFCFDGFQPCRELPVEKVLLGLRHLRDTASNLYGLGKRQNPGPQVDTAQAEYEIMRAFRSMEIQLLTHVDERERLLQEEYLETKRAGRDTIPTTFQNVEEAKSSLELVIRKSMYGLRNSMRIHRFPRQSENPKDAHSSEFYCSDPRLNERAAILQTYETWDDAFRPLLNFARSKGSSEQNFLRASLLRLHWLSGYLSLSSNSSQSSIVNNKGFTNELEELISISSLLLKKCQSRQTSPPGSGSDDDDFLMNQDSMFNFDMQIIVPIMTVGWTCRNRTLRQEAIELLSRSPKMEGTWDGVVIAKVMSWLTQIEEECLEKGEENKSYIPDSAAARCIRMSLDMERRLALVTCLQPVRCAGPGEERERSIEIPW